MISPRLAVAAAAFALAACNPFHREPVVKMDARDLNVNSRWHGTLASPASLAGAVHINGSATMTPGDASGDTRVTLDVSNAAPGGVHPWQVHMGQCGSDEGVFGSSSAYRPVTVDEKGRAESTANVSMAMPTDGRYYVSMSASSANAETIVACGNLAAPSR